MHILLWQTYRHLVQQAIVRHEMRPSTKRSLAWETGSIAVLFGAAAACGALAQLHLS